MTNKSINHVSNRETAIDSKDFVVLFHDRQGSTNDLIYKVQLEKLKPLLNTDAITGGYINLVTGQLILTSTDGDIVINIAPIVPIDPVIGTFVNQTTFVVTHNFGRFAKTTLLDTSGKEQNGFNLYHTANTVTFSSNTPFSGTLVCH